MFSKRSSWKSLVIQLNIAHQLTPKTAVQKTTYNGGNITMSMGFQISFINLFGYWFHRFQINLQSCESTNFSFQIDEFSLVT